jgi:carboxymethylenebutenolidase
LIPELVGSLGVDPLAAAAAEQTWHEVEHEESVSDVLTLVQGPGYTKWALKALRSTVTVLSQEPGVGERVAVIGYGTGGGMAFALASADPRVRLALAYDSVGTDIDLVENIKGAAVSFYAADNVAAAQGLPDLRAAMRRAGVPFCAKPYPARHLSLTDLVTPRPHGSVAGDLWQRSLAMLRLHLV